MRHLQNEVAPLYRLARAIMRKFRQLRSLRATTGFHVINILETFPIYVAHGYGRYRARATLTVRNINLLPSALGQFVDRERSLPDSETSQQYRSAADNQLSSYLAERFAFYGSDKSTTHDYHLLYASLLGDTDVRAILEIGLGTNNLDVVSTMGRSGRPGASLRAFRDVFLTAEVFGADIDARILFSEERIVTFWVDQMDAKALNDICIPNGLQFDLMIDDGLHAPVANLNSLAYFLPRLRVGGWAVIEDVNPMTRGIWHLVSELINPQYRGEFVQTQAACVFVAQRLH